MTTEEDASAARSTFQKWIFGAELLALFPVAASMSALLHEWGYALYWGIPWELVRLTPELVLEHNVVKGVIWVLFISLGYLAVRQDLATLDLHLIARGASRKRRRIAALVARKLFYLPPAGLCLLVYFEWRDAISGARKISSTVSLGAILEIVLMVAVSLVACWLLESALKRRDLLASGVFVLLWVLGAYPQGWNDGQKRREFSMASVGEVTFVVLGAYGDSLIARPLRGGCTLNKTQILKSDEASFLRVPEPIGPLHLCPGEAVCVSN
jgi:hypothetical protein